MASRAFSVGSSSPTSISIKTTRDYERASVFVSNTRRLRAMHISYTPGDVTLANGEVCTNPAVDKVLVGTKIAVECVHEYCEGCNHVFVTTVKNLKQRENRKTGGCAIFQHDRSITRAGTVVVSAGRAKSLADCAAAEQGKCRACNAASAMQLFEERTRVQADGTEVTEYVVPKTPDEPSSTDAILVDPLSALYGVSTFSDEPLNFKCGKCGHALVKAVRNANVCEYCTCQSVCSDVACDLCAASSVEGSLNAANVTCTSREDAATYAALTVTGRMFTDYPDQLFITSELPDPYTAATGTGSVRPRSDSEELKIRHVPRDVGVGDPASIAIFCMVCKHIVVTQIGRLLRADGCEVCAGYAPCELPPAGHSDVDTSSGCAWCRAHRDPAKAGQLLTRNRNYGDMIGDVLARRLAPGRVLEVKDGTSPREWKACLRKHDAASAALGGTPRYQWLMYREHPRISKDKDERAPTYPRRMDFLLIDTTSGNGVVVEADGDQHFVRNRRFDTKADNQLSNDVYKMVNVLQPALGRLQLEGVPICGIVRTAQRETFATPQRVISGSGLAPRPGAPVWRTECRHPGWINAMCGAVLQLAAKPAITHAYSVDELMERVQLICNPKQRRGQEQYGVWTAHMQLLRIMLKVSKLARVSHETADPSDSERYDAATTAAAASSHRPGMLPPDTCDDTIPLQMQEAPQLKHPRADTPRKRAPDAYARAVGTGSASARARAGTRRPRTAAAATDLRSPDGASADTSNSDSRSGSGNYWHWQLDSETDTTDRPDELDVVSASAGEELHHAAHHAGKRTRLDNTSDYDDASSESPRKRPRWRWAYNGSCECTPTDPWYTITNADVRRARAIGCYVERGTEEYDPDSDVDKRYDMHKCPYVDGSQ